MTYYEAKMSPQRRRCLSVCDSFPNGSSIDKWAFTRCERFQGTRPVPFYIYATGPTVDYNHTAFGLIVVSRRLGEIISGIAPHDVQRIPVLLEGESGWELLNTLTCIDCIDYEHSHIDFYPDDFNDRTRAGKPRGVRCLRIFPERTTGHHIFRPRDWMVAEIVSETIKTALEQSGVTGIAFRPVTD